MTDASSRSARGLWSTRPAIEAFCPDAGPGSRLRCSRCTLTGGPCLGVKPQGGSRPEKMSGSGMPRWAAESRWPWSLLIQSDCRERRRRRSRRHIASCSAAAGCFVAFCLAVARDRGGRATRPGFANEMLDGNCPIRLSDIAKLAATPTIEGEIIVSRLALHHKALPRPVAYLDGVEIVPLLHRIRPGQCAHAVVQSWSKQMS